MKNYYDILGLKETASKEEVRTAYRKLSMKMHPDMNAEDAFFSEFFKNLNEANEILSNDAKRADYDRKLRNHITAEQELKRKEEEIRRKEEALYRKQWQQQQQKKQPQTTASNPQPAPQFIEPKKTDWRFIVNVLVIANLFLLGIIFITDPAKTKAATTQQDNSTSDQSQSTAPVKRTKQKKTAIIKKEQPQEQEPSALPPDDQPAPVTEQKQEVVQAQETTEIMPEINSPQNITKEKEEEKPGFFQFRKRKEWKKRQKAIQDSLAKAGN
jgi:curved DNA-binding protein CbpA